MSSFAAQAEVLLSFDPALTQGKTTAGLSGEYSIGEALAALLSGSGLDAVKSASGYVLRAAARREEDAAGETQLGTVTVTDSAIDFNDFPPDEGFKAEFQSSATKTPLSIRETPQSISVITQDSLEARQVIGLNQAFETAASITQSQEPGPFAGRSLFGFPEYQIRGIQSEYLFDVREDGFLVPQLFGAFDLAPYERVEVIKGPSSTLYGRGAAGGFVNLVRKKPLPEFHFEATGSAGSFDFYRGEVDMTGPLFRSDTVRGRLVAAYEDAGSFVDFVESERAVIAPSLEFDVTDSTRLLLEGTYQIDHAIANPGFPLQRDGKNFKAPDVPRSRFFGLPHDDKDDNPRKLIAGTLQLDQELGDHWLATLRLNRSATASSPRLTAPSMASVPRGIPPSIPSSSTTRRIAGRARCG